ncbi:ribosomal protein L7/L12 [Clostridium sp. ZS2-4]|uniref:ribosomal protein L7/L12 n=1 Tax=Clostridium sp. ZS2-4 TaxID=2987703 RepID=UPI00227B3993|nr:ribosomal protein L7/L12 [Clostridium sp. ZS2-4]MCY6354875.1 ribosomal protein L7/L12 [Clostridium sp. ZS2-4]
MNNTDIFAITIGLISLMVISTGISQLRNDIARMNTTLDKIAKQLGVPDTIIENIDNELKSLISQGKKIKVIKRYRMVTGLGLKESKEYIDSLSEQELI